MNNNTKIAVNSIIIFVRLCIVSVVGIIASRLVLDALGASDYGLYNVVGGIVALLNILNTTMVTTTYRFIAYEMGKGDSGNPNKVFNLSFSIHFVLAVVIIILGLTVGDWYVDHYLNVPESSLDDARFVFHISLLTVSLSTLLVPHQGLLVALEKFSVSAIIDIITSILRIAIIYFFLYNATNSLRFYSLLMLGYTILHCALFWLYNEIHYRKIVKLCIVNDRRTLKEMLSFSLWTLFGGFANIGKGQGIVMIINYFYGTIVNAAFAIANQVSGFITVFANSLSQAAIPQITKNFSGENTKRSMSLTCYISKYSFLLMLIVAFPVLIETDFLLSIWLKEVPEGSSTFCRLVILDALLGCFGAGIPALVNATGNIRVYQLVLYTFVFLGVPICFIFAKLGFNQYWIPIVYCIVTVGSAIIKLLMLKFYYKMDIKQLFDISYKVIIIVSFPLILAYLFFDSSSFSTGGHVLTLVLSELFVIIDILLLGTNNVERQLLLGYWSSLIRKIKK